MLKIKLARFGKKKQPHYRIVVNEARDKRDGAYVEAIGHYAPTMTPKVLTIDMVKYEDWKKKGAQPTETVAALVTRIQSGNPFPPKKAKLSKKAKAKAAAAAEEQAQAAEAAKAPAEAPVEEAQAPAEAPAAEATSETEAA
ncbi:30S ribosomal protein S16 [Patescibacteria group bacterium]|nr:30S ribosomal protein S16 [Patescibacteria group bacterium]